MLGNTLRTAGAELVATGWHEGGYYFVHFDAETDLMSACLEALKKFKYKGTTGRKREFKPTQGDLGGMRKRSHLNVEAYLKVNGKLD